MATKRKPTQAEVIASLRRHTRACDRRARLLDKTIADMRDRAINLNHKFLAAVGELREQYQGEPDALALELLAQHEERGADVAEAREFLEQQVPGDPGRSMEAMQAALRTELETLRAGRVHDQLDEVDRARAVLEVVDHELLDGLGIVAHTWEDGDGQHSAGPRALNFAERLARIADVPARITALREERDAARRELASYLRRDLAGPRPGQRDPLRLAKEVSL